MSTILCSVGLLALASVPELGVPRLQPFKDQPTAQLVQDKEDKFNRPKRPNTRRQEFGAPRQPYTTFPPVQLEREPRKPDETGKVKKRDRKIFYF